MSPKGGQPNNKNAALPSEQWPRLNVTLTLSGETLMQYVKYLQDTTGLGEEGVTPDFVKMCARAASLHYIEQLSKQH